MKYSSHSSLSVCNKEAAKFSKAPEIGQILSDSETMKLFFVRVYFIPTFSLIKADHFSVIALIINICVFL